MKYEDYDIGNFITDEFFIQWIKNPNEENTHFWEKWVAQHPGKRILVNEAASLIRSIKYGYSNEFTDKMYVEMFEQIVRTDTSFRKIGSVSPKKRSLWSFFPLRNIAATILISFCLWAQYEAVQFNPSENVEIFWIKRSNPKGQKSIIELPDGTKIHLNSGSEIEFPQEFSSDLRFVKLKGEAFFEVQKEKRPFLVQTGNTEIQVLGTSFNVNQKENGSIYVALVTGKVSVKTDDGSRMNLDPNEMLILEEGGAFRKTGFDLDDIVRWKDNYLIFKSSNIYEVKEKLEIWYDVTISLEGEFDSSLTYTGTYNDEMLENVLRGICTTSGIDYQIDNKKVILTNPK